METTDTISWVLVTRKDDHPDFALNVCHFCAIVFTDDEMRTELREVPNDLGPGEDLHCECCDGLIARGAPPDPHPHSSWDY